MTLLAQLRRALQLARTALERLNRACRLPMAQSWDVSPRLAAKPGLLRVGPSREGPTFNPSRAFVQLFCASDLHERAGNAKSVKAAPARLIHQGQQRGSQVLHLLFRLGDEAGRLCST